MNLIMLRKLAHQKALKKTNPRSVFARMHPGEQRAIIDKVYKPDMTDDELFKAITHKITHPDYEKTYDELIAPNKKLEAEADKILAENPEPNNLDTEDLFNIDRYDHEFTDDDELLQNLVVEQINAAKAREYDKRYRQAYAIYERQKYQPTLGPVYHVRRNTYKPQVYEKRGAKVPFNELLENADHPFAASEIPTEVGSGISPQKYIEFLEYIRSK